MNRKAASGVDGVDRTVFEADLEENVRQLATALKEKRYKAKLIRRRNIPKPGGKQRPLGIPVIGDKLVQTAAAQILSAIYEQDFLPCWLTFTCTMHWTYGLRRLSSPSAMAM
ncbi:MAG: hypothetical protein R6V20_02220 [Desulfobia sp.]